MNMIEKDIWDYIDGTCTPQERIRIEQQIEADPLYKAVYREFTSLDADLQKLDFEEPSMSFTRNVMEAIKTEPVPGSLKSLIDKRIIYGIAAFFGITFIFMLGVLLFSIDWSQQSSLTMPEFKMPAVTLDSVLNSRFIVVFYFVDIVLALYFLDGVFRKRLHSK